MKPESIYRLDAVKTLSGFQMLEFSLKIYISVAYNLIAHKVSGIVPFKYKYKDIKNHPLEKLLNLFQKHNDNVDLQKRLNRLRQKRNDLAHTDLLIAHEELRDILGKDLTENHVSIQEVQKELDECLKIMAGELDNIFKVKADA